MYEYEKLYFSRVNLSALQVMPLSSAEPYEFLVKLRNITWETNYVIVSQNALGMMVMLLSTGALHSIVSQNALGMMVMLLSTGALHSNKLKYTKLEY